MFRHKHGVFRREFRLQLATGLPTPPLSLHHPCRLRHSVDTGCATHSKPTCSSLSTMVKYALAYAVVAQL